VVNRSRKNEYIDLLLDSLKNKNKFPYEIKTKRCYAHIENCKEHHDEIVVTSYDTKTEKFHLQYYSTHEPGVQFEYDQPKEFVKELILRVLNSRRRVTRVRDLKKSLNSLNN